MLISITGMVIEPGLITMTPEAAKELIGELTEMLDEAKDHGEYKAMLMCDSGTTNLWIKKPGKPSIYSPGSKPLPWKPLPE